jgi:hypothetical protein
MKDPFADDRLALAVVVAALFLLSCGALVSWGLR